jgi:hypothetical protein
MKLAALMAIAVVVSSLVVLAPLSAADTIVIPELQKPVEDGQPRSSSAGVMARVYVPLNGQFS